MVHFAKIKILRIYFRETKIHPTLVHNAAWIRPQEFLFIYLAHTHTHTLNAIQEGLETHFIFVQQGVRPVKTPGGGGGEGQRTHFLKINFGNWKSRPKENTKNFSLGLAFFCLVVRSEIFIDTWYVTSNQWEVFTVRKIKLMTLLLGSMWQILYPFPLFD